MVGVKEVVTAVGTLGCAIGIGFVMQNSSEAELRYGKPVDRTDQVEEELTVSDAVLNVEQITLTSAEFENSVPVPEPVAEVIKTSAPQELPAPSIPETATIPACEISATARPIAAAMVKLTLDASCMPSERVTIHHSGMIFTETTSSEGRLDMTVPALAQNAVFIVAFSNGEGAVAQTMVEELVDFDRIVVQWKGQTGFQIHAREFGANYGDSGHIWAENPGEIADAVTGRSGFIVQKGDPETPEALLAEVYSFPVSAVDRTGDILLTVEAEVSKMNCGLEIEAQAIEVIEGGEMKTRNLSLSVPDCDSSGDFLVLNNLLEDLKVAAK